MEGLEHDLLPRDDRAAELLGVRLHSLDAAIERALRDWEVERALGGAVADLALVSAAAMSIVHAKIEIDAPIERVWETIMDPDRLGRMGDDPPLGQRGLGPATEAGLDDRQVAPHARRLIPRALDLAESALPPC